MFGRLAMGFANVRAGTRVLMLVLVLVQAMSGLEVSVNVDSLIMRATVARSAEQVRRMALVNTPPSLVNTPPSLLNGMPLPCK